MDPLRSGAIFKIKDFSALRSPNSVTKTNKTVTTTSSTANNNSNGSSISNIETSVVIKAKFDLLYRATPVILMHRDHNYDQSMQDTNSGVTHANRTNDSYNYDVSHSNQTSGHNYTSMLYQSPSNASLIRTISQPLYNSQSIGQRPGAAKATPYYSLPPFLSPAMQRAPYNLYSASAPIRANTTTASLQDGLVVHSDSDKLAITFSATNESLPKDKGEALSYTDSNKDRLSRELAYIDQSYGLISSDAVDDPSVTSEDSSVVSNSDTNRTSLNGSHSISHSANSNSNVDSSKRKVSEDNVEKIIISRSAKAGGENNNSDRGASGNSSRRADGNDATMRKKSSIVSRKSNVAMKEVDFAKRKSSSSSGKNKTEQSATRENNEPLAHRLFEVSAENIISTSRRSISSKAERRISEEVKEDGGNSTLNTKKDINSHGNNIKTRKDNPKVNKNVTSGKESSILAPENELKKEKSSIGPKRSNSEGLLANKKRRVDCQDSLLSMVLSSSSGSDKIKATSPLEIVKSQSNAKRSSVSAANNLEQCSRKASPTRTTAGSTEIFEKTEIKVTQTRSGRMSISSVRMADQEYKSVPQHSKKTPYKDSHATKSIDQARNIEQKDSLGSSASKAHTMLKSSNLADDTNAFLPGRNSEAGKVSKSKKKSSGKASIKKSRVGLLSKVQSIEKESEIEKRDWLPSEIIALYAVYKMVDPTDPQFWKEISNELKKNNVHRSDSECQEQWFSALKQAEERKKRNMLIKKQKQEVSLQQKVDLINNASTVDNKDIEVAMKGKKLNNKDLKALAEHSIKTAKQDDIFAIDNHKIIQQKIGLSKGMYKGIIDTDSLHLDLLMNSFDSINSPQSVAIKKNTTNMLLSQSEVGEEENENRSLFANKSSYVHKLKDRRVVANSRTNNNGVSTKSKKSIASNLLSKNSRKKVSKELKNLLESNSEFRLSDNSEEEDYFSEEDY